MKASERIRLRNVLRELDEGERRRLYKRAGKLRKATRNGNGRGAALDDIVCDLLALEAAAPPTIAAEETPTVAATAATLEGVVVAVGRGRCVVVCQGRQIDCVVPPGMAAAAEGGPATGDLAAVEIVDPGAGQGRLRGLHPRRSHLTRSDPHDRHRLLVVAANVDVAVVVVPLAPPGIKPRFIDRYLVAAARGGVEALVCATKLDLVPAAERTAAEAPLCDYRALGLSVVCVSSMTGEGLEALRTALAGRTCALVGHSGVGKTSLLNALAPQLGLATAAVRDADGRGRHTTTASSLHELPGDIRIIDTPGIRQLGLGEVTTAELAAAFADVAAEAHGCRFRDCTHTHEPDCGVKAAVDGGRLSSDRYDSYLRLVGAAADGRS